MTSALQATIASPISFKGRGLHTGKRAQIMIYPADANRGIVFRRIDKAGRSVDHNAGTEIHACGIDNALVDVNGNELSILDGSA